ncbi:MAG: hypothetical protein E7633_05150 [Ruminococcaceae bacterium]|nr:hypothetical protein [Oscillospiraceae bacterium]
MVNAEGRWTLIVGDYTNMEALAADKLYDLVSEYTEYLVEIQKANNIDEDFISHRNAVIIGTPKSNTFIDKLIKNEKIPTPDGEEGYYISVEKNFKNESYQMIIVSANTDKGLLYGSCDLINNYFSNEVFRRNDFNKLRTPKIFAEPFKEKLPEYSRLTSPAVKKRALWTWGHCIYDYKRFFDNMAELRLNEIVIWNDFCPINANEVVSYAHSRGIDVIWGYAWGWDNSNTTPVDLVTRNNWESLSEQILKTYEDSYISTGADGIYFQSFTETGARTRDGVVIAEAVVDWVNFVARKFFEKYPQLRIQFGLHATSVKSDLNYLEKVDNRMEIVWENCGAFPYCYNPSNVADFENTLTFSKKIAKLRGEDDKFGVVIKGMTTLSWAEFEHHSGPYLLGVQGKAYIKKRTADKSRYWRHIQSKWMANAKYPYETIKLLTEEKNGELDVQLLVEDGIFEDRIYFPTLLSAELIWDSSEPLDKIIERVMMNKHMSFAEFEY